MPTTGFQNPHKKKTGAAEAANSQASSSTVFHASASTADRKPLGTSSPEEDKDAKPVAVAHIMRNIELQIAPRRRMEGSRKNVIEQMMKKATDKASPDDLLGISKGHG